MAWTVRATALACLVCLQFGQAAVVYDFETIPAGTTTTFAYPDGTTFYSSPEHTFHVVSMFGTFVSQNVLRDEQPISNQRSLMIQFPRVYNSISVDFALNSLSVGPYLSLYLQNSTVPGSPGGALTVQGQFVFGPYPEGQLLIEDVSFDQAYLIACESATPGTSAAGGCNFPGGSGMPISFAIDNIKVAVIPEPATNILLPVCAYVLALLSHKMRRAG